MRISDWSSDVCSSDLLEATAHVMFGGITHPPAVELAELLVEIAPAGLEHVFFADSGSVAVEVAIKMALQHARGTGRPDRTRLDRKSTRLNSSHSCASPMPSSA